MLSGLRNRARAEASSGADKLTGLPSDRAVEGSLRRMIAQSGRNAVGAAGTWGVDLDAYDKARGE